MLGSDGPAVDVASPGASVSEGDDITDPVAPAPRAKRRLRWQAVIGLASVAGLAIAAVSSVDDAREQALPGAPTLAAALVLQVVAMTLVARGWATLFPAGADRDTIRRGLYTSQLTKYLPAGGFVQAASQVALSSGDTGLALAAMRLPVFSTCSLAAAGTAGAALIAVGDLPTWARVLAALGLGLLVLLDRRVLARFLNLARRLIRRLPPPDALPDQRAILRCYGYILVNQVVYASAFVVLLSDLADVLAALPGLAMGSVLASSVAHRLTSFVAEALLAGRAHLAAAGRRRTR
jgi:hypothetical protein